MKMPPLFRIFAVYLRVMRVPKVPRHVTRRGSRARREPRSLEDQRSLASADQEMMILKAATDSTCWMVGVGVASKL